MIGELTCITRKMGRSAFVILLFGIIYSAFNRNDVNGKKNVLLKDVEKENQDQPENVNGDTEILHLTDEINAINAHVKYQDVARDTLLEFSAALRKRKNATNEVTNTFLKVIDSFEKKIAEFHAVLHRRKIKPDAILNLKKLIEKAAKNATTNTKILRSLTSQGLFLSQVRSIRGKRSVRHLQLGARDFLKTIQSDLGNAVFESFLAIDGKATLIFVVDDTGSMGGDIASAKAIAKNIVTARKKDDNDVVKVDYILSPFNDPKTGPITRKDWEESEDFLKAIDALRVRGGGDCKELGFKGMINALDEGPLPGSPMYVFTDAPPKDATDQNREDVRDLAHSEDIKIHFFLRESCGTDFHYYKELASDTGGRVFELSNALDLKKLGELVEQDLQQTTTLLSNDWGWVSSRGRRAVGDKTYPIPVDDSIEKGSILVTVENNPNGVSLKDPSGNTVSVGRVLLKTGVVYDIERPITGVYELVIPASAGRHKYRVDVTSGVNIAFGHYYVSIAQRGTRIPIPLEQPLQGFPVKAFITVAGSKSVNAGSLKIKVVGKTGATHADQSLIPVGTSGVRYFARFDPPKEPFKLLLHGFTTTGNPFVRESSNLDQTVPVLLKLSYKEASNILHRGKSTRLIVQILRGNTGDKAQKYTFKLKDDRGYGSVTKVPRSVYRGRKGFARITYVVPTDAPSGKILNVKFSLTRDGETVPVATLLSSFLLV